MPAVWGSTDKGRATKGSAEALLAEQYIWRKDWPNAATFAKKIIDSGNYGLQANYIQAFLPGSQNRNEEVFAAQSSSATGAPAIDIAAWEYPRNMNPNSNGGWGTWQPLQAFIDAYPAGDYRKEVSFFTSGIDPTGKHGHLPAARLQVPPDGASGTAGRELADLSLRRRAADVRRGAQRAGPDRTRRSAYVNMIRARARNGTGSGGRVRCRPICRRD